MTRWHKAWHEDQKRIAIRKARQNYVINGIMIVIGFGIVYVGIFVLALNYVSQSWRLFGYCLFVMLAVCWNIANAINTIRWTYQHIKKLKKEL